jgi:hypothetical protein
VAFVTQKLARCGELTQFFLRQRIVGFTIGDEPYLEPESIGVFKSCLQDCRFYLEYGSGGSTVFAAHLGKRFISVETDRYYMAAVRKKIGALSPGQRLVHADVGMTGPWGTPFWRRPTPTKLGKWSDSLEAPWRFIQRGDYPDLVLIDGRFRVAAALTCCLHLPTSGQNRIVVDDYTTSPYYHPIEKYAQLTTTVGRMAIFQPSPSTSVDDLRTAIAHYATDWR